MPLALTTLSHSPLLEISAPPPDVAGRVDAALAGARDFAQQFAPDVVILFAPDHFNGFFYELMPPACIGIAAHGVGDFGSSTAPLDVPERLARDLTQAALDGGVDVAMSLRMALDHGAVQPLEILFGTPDAVPVVPIFLNCAGPPLGPIARMRRLGAVLGDALRDYDGRVLLVGSGGLSHDPPVPSLDTATPEQRERLTERTLPTPAAMAARREKVVAEAERFTAGTATCRDLNPVWDTQVLDLLAGGDLAAFDDFDNDAIIADGGRGAQEIRTWIAAYSALATAGPYEVTHRFYEPVREYIAGFGVTTAVPR